MQSGKELFDNKIFFKEAIEKDKLASCYLFTGDDYLRKVEIARYVSKASNCREALNGRDCFCEACVKIESFNHPDVVWLKSVSGKKIKIDDIRALIDKIYLKPYMGRGKIFIVEDAELLTEEAQNAFLKTLEEPPVDSIIILMVRQRESLLPTIISRCQLVKFLSGASGEDTDSFVKDFLFCRNRLELLGEFAKKMKRQQAEQFLDSLLICFRDALAYKITGKNQSEGKDISCMEKIIALYSLDKIESMTEEIIRIKDFVRRNVNPKIALSVLCLALEEGIENA